MSNATSRHPQPRVSSAPRQGILAAAALVAGLASAASAGALELADQPLFSASSAPGNLILALSVEWPTATSPAYPSTTAYTPARAFLGYFDPAKCYRYVPDRAVPQNSYFAPHSAAAARTCRSGPGLALWSGNYLNWASMQTLDGFRWALTGGYRSLDLPGTTHLTKTWSIERGSGDNPDKTLADGLAGATPFGWASATTRIKGLGTAMYITGTRTVVAKADERNGCVAKQRCIVDAADRDYGGETSALAKGLPGHADPAVVYRLYINVKVCDAAVGLEDNCVRYAAGAKPEGLMQAHAMKLRYSAFGYYNEQAGRRLQRDGGVMRSRMDFIGPRKPRPGASAVPNAAAEWDPETGVMRANPAPADAAAASAFAAAAGWNVPVSQSGAMNYLNKFGYEMKDYKGHDPVGELYYAALRYLRNLGNVAAYTDLSQAGNAERARQWLDGFPAITRWDDPVQYSCQKNFILGIGDVNTHHDANLPGSTLRALSPGEPPLPAEVAADTGVNVHMATGMVGQLEGRKGLGDTFAAWGNRACPNDQVQCNTYYIAGLAYHAHTGDIRADLPGRQNVDTYWMDVVEDQVYKHKNAYWLAAKYGGFSIPDAFDPYAPGNGPATLPEISWTSNPDTLQYPPDANGLLDYSSDSKDRSDRRPDNYFTGATPEAMQAGLAEAFARMTSETSAAFGTSLAAASPNVAAAGALNYAASYDPKGWSGRLTASTLSFDANGVPAALQRWDARALLDATAPAARKIVTCCTGSGQALPFTPAALKQPDLHSRTNVASFAKVPGVAAQRQSVDDFIAYLRGERSKEASQPGGIYRSRSHRLGDIVGSKLAVVAAPAGALFDSLNPGYGAFKREHAKRRSVVYAGANDGMLHAFDGSAGEAGSGRELFAYIPSFVYGSDASAPVSGLASLGSRAFSHHYQVDGSPAAFDVDFGRTAGAGQTAADWRTLLVGGLGKGGRGYYAIDVTDPAAWGSEAEVARKVLWEFTDPRMGYSYGMPSVVKTAKYGWVVVLTSGYDNADGMGWFFLVNPRTGALLEAVATPEGSAAEPLGLAHHTAFVPDYSDGSADAAYAADLRGNVWRLDLTPREGRLAAPVKLAKLTGSGARPQPVTTRPLVEIDPRSGKRVVLLGTGALLADSDIADPQPQSFYALHDGKATHGGFLPAAGLPLDRGGLALVADPAAGPAAAPGGWVLDLAQVNGIGERVNVQPVANAGVVAFAANLPDGKVCDPAGSSRAFAIDFGNGRSVLENEKGGLIAASTEVPGIVTELAFQRVAGKQRLHAGGSRGDVVNLRARLGAPAGLRQLNWREVPLAD